MSVYEPMHSEGRHSPKYVSLEKGEVVLRIPHFMLSLETQLQVIREVLVSGRNLRVIQVPEGEEP